MPNFRAFLFLAFMMLGLCSCKTPVSSARQREETAGGITFSISIPPKIPENQIIPLEIKIRNTSVNPVKCQLCRTEVRLRSNGAFVKPRERVHRWIRYWDSEKPYYLSTSEMAALERYGGPSILIHPQHSESLVVDLLENYKLEAGHYSVEMKSSLESFSSQGTFETNLEIRDLTFEIVQADVP